MKSFVNDLYGYEYTGKHEENNEEESVNGEGEENTTNKNNENVIEIN